MKKKIIYVAGKYSDSTIHKQFINIEVARREAEFVWSRGAVAICPHLNSSWMDGVCDEREFLSGYLDVLELCDAIYLCWNWQDSSGTIAEVKRAEERGIVVIKSRPELMDYLGTNNDTSAF